MVPRATGSTGSGPRSMKKSKKPTRKPEKGVIPLKDLAPRNDPKGGKGQNTPSVFGAGTGINGARPPGGKTKVPRKRG